MILKDFFSSLSALVEANIAKSLTALFEKLHPPLVRNKTYRVNTFTPKQWTSEVNHSGTIMIIIMQNLQDSFMLKWYRLKFFNLQDFIFKTRKQSFDSSFSLCVTVTLNEPI